MHKGTHLKAADFGFLLLSIGETEVRRNIKRVQTANLDSLGIIQCFY